MSRPAEQLLALYRGHRIRQQLDWYTRRIQELDAANRQLRTLSVATLVLTALASLLSALRAVEPLFAVLAVLFPSFGAGLVAFGALYAFDRQVKLYRDGARALDRARSEEPAIEDLSSEEAASAVAHWIASVEDVFRNEQGQWGQLVANIRAPR